MTSKGWFLLVMILAILLKGSLEELEYIEADNCFEYNSWDYNVMARRLQCNDTFPLHCAQLQNSETFALRCLKAKNCTQGQQPFIPSDASDTVLCKSCHGNTFNSDYSKPSNSYTTCTPMTTLTEGLIPCEHLKLKTSDPEYHNHNHYMRCNISENYVLDNSSVFNSTRDMNGYCTNETKPRCIKQQCIEEEELIKDYSCVDKCRSDEYRADNLTCVKHQTGPSTTPGPLTTPGHVTNVVRKESSPQPASPTVTQTTEPTKNESTDDTKNKEVDSGVPVYIYNNCIIIGIGSIIFVVLLGRLFAWLVDCINRAYFQKQKDDSGDRAESSPLLSEVQREHAAQPNQAEDDSGDRAESSPLLSEVQREHAAQPNQAEDQPDSSGEESAAQQPIEKWSPIQHFKMKGAKISVRVKNETNNYFYTVQGPTQPKPTNKKASQKNGKSDGDRSHNMYPQQETGADNQGSQQPNTDNGVNLETLAKYPYPESGAGNQRSHPPYTDIGPSEDTLGGFKVYYKYPHPETGAGNQRSHPPNTDISVSEDSLEPFPRTFGDVKDKLRRAISWEEKVDVILNHFGQLPNKRNSWDMFCSYCNWIHENVFMKNLLPSLPLPHVPCRPNSPEKKYRNTPEGFTAFESSGRHNSCLYQSVSLLLVGDESRYKLLRLMTAVFAARNFEMAAKRIRGHLKHELLDVDLYYRHHLTDKVFERHKDEMNTKEQNKKYLQEIIMETPVLDTMSSQIHAMFLCGAIGRPIHQHLLPQHEHYRHMFHEQLDPKACFSDEGYDEKLAKLHIMWVNNEDNPNKEINHVVPLWYHPVNQSPEATAFKGNMTTQEDKKCDNKKNDDGAADENDDEKYDDNEEKEPLLLVCNTQ